MPRVFRRGSRFALRVSAAVLRSNGLKVTALALMRSILRALPSERMKITAKPSMRRAGGVFARIPVVRRFPARKRFVPRLPKSNPAEAFPKTIAHSPAPMNRTDRIDAV